MTNLMPLPDRLQRGRRVTEEARQRRIRAARSVLRVVPTEEELRAGKVQGETAGETPEPQPPQSSREH